MTSIESPGAHPETGTATPTSSAGTPKNVPRRKPIPPPPGRSLPPGFPKSVPSTGFPPVAGKADRVCATTGPTFPEETVRVSALADPVLDSLGHDPRSNYVEQFWLPILGPSCLLLLRRFAAEMEANPDGFELCSAEWASRLGVGTKGGKHGPFWRAVERACRFGAAQRNGDVLAVRRKLPPLTARQVGRLTAELQASHNAWTETRLTKPKRQTVTVWSERRVLQDRTLDDAA